MTDNETVKALECCISNTDENCNKCVCSGSNVSCVDVLLQNALDLINCLQAENKELLEISKKLNEELEITRAYIHDNGLEWALLSYSKRVGR